MTMTNRSTIVGVFHDQASAERAIQALGAAGFTPDQMLYSGHATAQQGGFFASLKNMFTPDETTSESRSILSDLTGMGVPTSAAQYYEREQEAGHPVVAVRTQGGSQNAIEIMRQHGAYDATTRAGVHDPSATGYQGQATASSVRPTTSPTQPIATGKNTVLNEPDEERRLKLREEQLQASKQAVRTGEVEIHKEIVTEQQTINVPVMHEEVVIEYHPGSGQKVDAASLGENESIRVPVREEQVHASKQTVERGEISIGKRAVEETKQVSDTVKREEARIEREGEAPIHGMRRDDLPPNQRSQGNP